MTVIATLDFNATADGALSASAPWATNGVAPVVGAGAALHGAKGIAWASTGTAGRLTYDYGTNQTGLIVLSTYFRVDTLSTANHYINAVYNLASGGSLQGDWRINPADQRVTIRNGGTAVATSSVSLAAATVYRAEWAINPTAGTQELRIYAGEGTTPILTLTGAWSSASTRVWSVGPNVAAAAGAITYDTIRVADTWTGPLVGLGPPPSLDVDQRAPNVVDLRDSVSGDGSALTYPTPTRVSGATLTATALTPGVWLFTQDPDDPAVYEVSCEQADTQTDDDTVTIPALPAPTNTAAPRRLLSPPPSTDWG